MQSYRCFNIIIKTVKIYKYIIIVDITFQTSNRYNDFVQL